MQRKHNNNLSANARALRKNMTKEEKHLWYDFLRTHQVKFLRQKVLGKYIVDFYSAKAKLVIEVDGSQHYEEEGFLQDEARTEFLKQFGVRVLRISNREINKNFAGVCQYIEDIIHDMLLE